MKRFIPLFLVVFLLSACGSSGGTSSPNAGGGAPTDTSILFSLFPATFFTNYNEVVVLNGTDNTGVSYTGSSSEKTLLPSTFLSMLTIPIERKISFTASNGAFGDALLNTHYSTDANNRQLVGFDVDIVTVSSNRTAIPQTAKIGASGIVGTYVDSRGFETSLSWRLDDGKNGNAKLVFLDTTNNALGALDNTVTTTYLIDANGNRISIEMITFNKNVNITVTFSGTY